MLALFAACAADHLVAGSLLAACRHNRPFLCHGLVRAEVAAAAVVVFRNRRCAAEVVGSSRAGQEGGLG